MDSPSNIEELPSNKISQWGVSGVFCGYGRGLRTEGLSCRSYVKSESSHAGSDVTIDTSS